MDGYFPSEFKKSYPDGVRSSARHLFGWRLLLLNRFRAWHLQVVLDVVDKCEEEYGTTKFKPFSGKGAAVGDSNVRSLADVGGSDVRPAQVCAVLLCARLVTAVATVPTAQAGVLGCPPCVGDQERQGDPSQSRRGHSA